MHRILIIITLFVFVISNTAYSMTTKDYVNALENKLFGTTFPNQTLDERVDRIEMQIYDNSYSGSAEERLTKIDKIYPKSEFETGKITQMKPPTTQNYSQNDMQIEEPADYNNYPIVSQIEENIFKQNYSGEDIYKRLARLEKELYGNIKSDESLENRVERLRNVLPDKKQNCFTAQNTGLNKTTSIPPASYMQNSEYNVSDILSELEIETFNKSYKKDLISKRIERLENYYYGGISMGQNENDRLLKLATVVMSSRGMKDYYTSSSGRGAQWAEILMNILIVGLGLLM